MHTNDSFPGPLLRFARLGYETRVRFENFRKPLCEHKVPALGEN